MKRLRSIFRFPYFPMLALMLACGGGSGGEQPAPEPEPSNDLPTKVVGTIPANGEPCSDYEELTSDISKVEIFFSWNSAKYTNSYELVIMEGDSEIFRNTYTVLETRVALERGKTFSWSIRSINEFGETSGDTYSFTTPGTPIGNYAPYAAQITLGFDIATLEMSINWNGSDEDNDGLTYDITIMENENIILEEVGLVVDTLDPIPFIGGYNYSAEVISRDTSGNFSVSRSSAIAPK